MRVEKLEKLVVGFEDDAYHATHKMNIPNAERDKLDNTYDEICSKLYDVRNRNSVQALLDRMSEAMADIANGTVVYHD
jgi:hypothetical protein